MEKFKSYIKYLIMSSILIFLFLNQVYPKWDIQDSIDVSVFIVVGLFTIYSKYFWRFNPLEKTPKIFGNYYVTFLSNYDKKKRDMEIKIEQTLLKTKIKIITKESDSISLVSNVEKVNDEWKLIYTYMNTPNISKRNNSSIHLGTCILSIENNKIISGYYYTERNTFGEIKFTTK